MIQLQENILEKFVKKAETAISYLTQRSDLYHNKVFTVVPKDLPLNQGILPDDQGFSNHYVFIWDNWKSLIPFDDQKWKKVSILLPPHIKFSSLTRVPADGYGIPFVSNLWPIKEQNNEPQYVQ